MNYFIATFGCQMNKADSERIASLLEKKGYKEASKITEADLLVVNMCSVRQPAVDRVYGLSCKFKKIKKINPNFKTILTGCITKKDKIKLKNKFDDIWKNDYIDLIPKKRKNSLAYIPISNGCNNFCSYCVVPFTRGSLKCRDHKEILKEAQGAIKDGFKELWLLGQNVNDYSSPADPAIDFPKLMAKVADLPGEFKIRFTSSHPANFTDELIDVIAKSEKIAKYIGLPLQSGDDEILKKMNRPYTAKDYIKLVKKIRKKIPQINLTTDVIVGFPGESKKQFENTVKLFKEIKFNLAYINKYSPRPGTTAMQLEDDIPLAEKKRREKILAEIIKNHG
jgi:tRNA-2-methylthio-N6-dimethylallyladenosine synthase